MAQNTSPIISFEKTLSYAPTNYKAVIATDQPVIQFIHTEEMLINHVPC